MNNVNLKIYNKTYKLKVSEAQEEIIRARAAAINQLIETYKKQFPSLGDFDYLALAVINDWAEHINSENDKLAIKKELDILDTLLS